MKFPMPMPISKEPKIEGNATDLQYLSFANARKLPFTIKFQPLLETIALHVAAKKKKFKAPQHFGVSRCVLALNIQKLKNKYIFKSSVASKVQGVVGCID